MTPAAGGCPACGGTRVRRAFRAPSAARYRRCRDCGSVFDTQPPSAEHVERLYTTAGRAYFVKDDPAAVAAVGIDTELWGYPADHVADRAFVEAKFDEVVAHLERYVPVGRLLDVGAGPGFLVSAAAARGWDARGIDLNPWAAEHARDELGVQVHVGSLDEGAFAGEQFDAVTMMDVIEHVPDPEPVLANLARLVRPGGVAVVLTPDAGAPLSRALGARWPEVQRPGEHVVLYSRGGLAAALRRHGFVPSGWHTAGKMATVATLVDDVGVALPKALAGLGRRVQSSRVGPRVVELDTRTKFVVYARRLPEGSTPAAHAPARIPKRPEALAHVDDAIVEELESLGRAEHYGDWLYGTFAPHVPAARVLEVGAGIGTFTARMLADGARVVVLIEPEGPCADVLDDRFRGERRVQVHRDLLPEAPCLAGEAGAFDLVVCQNVLEHIGDDTGSVAAMARALRPGGHLALVVPAGPRLFGSLDEAYGHWRRYDSAMLRSVVTGAGLEVEELRPMNGLGIPGWWVKNRRVGARVGPTSLKAYEALVAVWRPIEERLRLPVGLSLVCVARRPAEGWGPGDAPGYAAGR
jgi:2-polyprenyl-3-methyl-5-hydroxy-6-metoxy-1,4-benzoquinol methylase